jgi:CBS domain containing-hemolysin-like protein
VGQPDGTYLLDGMLAVRDANRQFGLDLPEGAGYTTLAGFLMAQSGRVLVPGDSVEYRGALFRVERAQRFRIRWVRFTPPRREEVKSAATTSVAALLPFAAAASEVGAHALPPL